MLFKRLYIRITSKKHKESILKYDISYLTGNEIRDLKLSLQRTIKANKENNNNNNNNNGNKFEVEEAQTSNGQDAPVLVKEELVVTRHIDATGNELEPVELGEKGSKDLKGYNIIEISKKDGIITHVYGVEKTEAKASEKVVEKANVVKNERKLPNTGMNTTSTTALGLSLIALVGAAVRRKLSE